MMFFALSNSDMMSLTRKARETSLESGIEEIKHADGVKNS